MEDQYTFCIISGSVLRMGNVLDKSCRENQNRHFMCNNSPPQRKKIVPLLGKLEKYSRGGQATDDNMGHVHCMLDI
jgi:hypothetical protein